MRTKELTCSSCDKKFAKNYAEFKRCWKGGQRRFYCCQSCQVSAGNRQSPRGTTAHLDPGNRRSELSPFKWFMARVRQRSKEVDLDLQYLKELWDAQSGICPLTGWRLVLPNDSMGWVGGKCPENASLDRIDSSRGYVRGNVQFVALIGNLAKADFNTCDVIAFCKAVTNRRPHEDREVLLPNVSTRAADEVCLDDSHQEGEGGETQSEARPEGR